MLSHALGDLEIRASMEPHWLDLLPQIPRIRAALDNVETSIVRLCTDSKYVAHPWTLTAAAKELGMSRTTLYNRYFDH
jgi:transcriptional regulator of acetoin/glycerol metabolism